jgi:hypothetical protein
MKKILYLVLFFAVLDAHAKITYSIGIKGGPVFGRFKNYSLEGSKKSSLGGQFSSRIGGGGGINGRIWFNKFIGIDLGVEFNMGGNIQKAQQQMPTGFRERILTHKINYITIPLVAHLGWGNDRLRVYGTAGGYYALPVHGRENYDEYINKNLVTSTSYKKDIDFDNEFTKNDIGIRFGAGIEAYVSKNKRHGVTFDATYDWGLTKVYRDVIDDLDDKTKFTNSRTNIQVGYIYRFGVDEKKTASTKTKTEKAKTEKVKEEKKAKEPKPEKVKEEKVKEESKAKEKKVKETKEKIMTE